MLKKSSIISIGRLLEIFEWVLFFTLALASWYFIKDVIKQFKSQKTSFAQYEESIQTWPSLIFCFEPNRFQFGNHFDVFYRVGYRGDYTKIKNEDLIEYSNDDNFTEKIQFQTFTSFACFKFNSIPEDFSQIGIQRAIEIKFDKDIKDDKMPKSLTVSVTSDKNSYGAGLNKYLNGRPYRLITKLGEYVKIRVSPEKYVYLREKTQCLDQTIYEAWESQLMEQLDLKDCPMQCLSMKMPTNNSVSLCPSTKIKEKNCVRSKINANFVKFISSGNFSRSCTKSQYSGEIEEIKIKEDDKNVFTLAYTFSLPETTLVNEEYLIYDIVGVVGSVGGTLGMFIGFSFIGVFSFLFDCVRKISSN